MVMPKQLDLALELHPQPNRLRQYTLNLIAVLLSGLGLFMLLAFASPKSDFPGQKAFHTSMPLSLDAPLDFSDLNQSPENIIRTGVLTETVTALDAMEVLGADRQQADAALTTLRRKGLIGLEGLDSGISISVHLQAGDAGNDGRSLNALTLRPEPGRSLIAKRLHDGTYFASELNSRLSLSHRRIAGILQSTLSEDMTKSGATKSQTAQFLSVFAYSSAVPRRLSGGDRFELVYEVWEDERGQKIATGDLVYASLESDAISRSFYRYTPSDNGITDFFDADGDSAERFLMRRPVPGGIVSSRFGRRRHPIGGYVHVHKGVDFRAPMSARIYAAGDGVVEKMGRNGGYGRQVVIRHANGYKTAYAHMSGYSRQLYIGGRVKQGDLVGFVGSTGHSTGPHLHYEVMLNGRHVDPMALQLPTGRKLKASPAILTNFDAHRKAIDAIRRDLGAGMEIADLGGSATLMRSLQAEAP